MSIVWQIDFQRASFAKMKMSTSPGGKKLKQARLTFGLAQPSPPKKAKLEVEEKPEPTPEVTVVISDEEVEREAEPAVDKNIDEKRLNPYVSMVDIALKRKLKRKGHTNGNAQVSKRPKIEDAGLESEVEEDNSEVNQVQVSDKTSNSDNEESADDEDKCNESMNDSTAVEDDKEESTDDKKDNEPKTPKSRKTSNRKLSSKQVYSMINIH